MARKIIGVWLVLNLIALPFPMNWLPNLGQFISTLLFPINQLFCRMFGEQIVQTFGSDSLIYFVQSIVLLAVSPILAVLLKKIVQRDNNSINKILHTSVSYLLFLFLFKYGIDKLFQHQFYTIEPNIAHTPVRLLSKDILFWSSMSSSQFYNTFMGSIEILVSALLLFHRTRLLGGLLCIGIMSNILAINIGFDISVKLLSSLLLLSSIYIATYYRNVFMLFFGKSGHYNYPNHELVLKNEKFNRVLKGTIIALFVFESLIPFARNSNSLEHELYGSYAVIKNRGALFNGAKRIHFTSSNYLVIEDADSDFSDYKIRLFDGTNQFEVNDIRFTFKEKNKRSLKLTWIENGEHLNVELFKINLKEQPVYQDEFHLTLESYYD